MLYQHEIQSFISEAIDRNRLSLEAAKRRLSAGMGSETDRLEFEIHRNALEQDLAHARLEARNHRRELLTLLGLPVNGEFEFPLRMDHSHKDELLSDSIEPDHHRDIKVLEAQAEVSSLAASRAARWWAPSLDLYGGYWLSNYRERNFDTLSDRLDTAAGVRLSLPLFDGGSALSDSRAKSREAEATRTRAEQTRRELKARLLGAQDELKLLHDLLHGAETAAEQARVYQKGTVSEYTRGLKNSPDVLSANQKLLEAQRRWADLRRDYQFARAGLRDILGE
jgi:outer membrane protein